MWYAAVEMPDEPIPGAELPAAGRLTVPMRRLPPMQPPRPARRRLAATIPLGFFIHDFWAGRKSPIFAVLAAPGAPKTMQKYGGLRPPYFCMVSRAPGAAQTPKIDDFRLAKKTMY